MLVIITVASLGLAFAMTLIAWRATREERRRAEARVAALAAEIRRGDSDGLPLRDASAGPTTFGAVESSAAVASASLFDDLAAVGRPSRTAAAIATVVFIVGSGAALAVVLTGSSGGSRAAAAAPARASAPLELVALGHERDGDSLAVYGAIRNPPTGAVVNGVSAVVFLYGRNGFTTSARAPIDAGDLAPGAESRFRVVVANAQGIERYRVSFRTDRGIVPHVDRRTPGAAGGPR